MKERLLCLLLLVAATVSTAYGQDACDNAREYDMNKMGECYSYFTAHDCALHSFSRFYLPEKVSIF